MSYNFYPSGVRIADRYEVAGRPLVGGMGIVYLCFDHQEQRPVALKTFKPEYLPNRDARERFLREGATWVALGRHPHIVHAYKVFQDNPRPEVYLVLELVATGEGQRDASLRSWLLPGHALPVAQALLFALQIVRGLAHAESVIDGFVHRDLKPENVLIGVERLAGSEINRLRVTDFGLVRVVSKRGESISTAGETDDIPEMPLGRIKLTDGALGTPLYMAPEQWTSGAVERRADIYALGCILYEMVVGAPAAVGNSLAALRQAHTNGQLRPLPSGLAASVTEVVQRCLALKPVERYGSWAELEDALAKVYGQLVGEAAPAALAAELLDRIARVAMGASFSAIGSSYMDIGKATVAIEHFHRVISVGWDEYEPSLTAVGFGGLGNAYVQLGNSRQAIEYYEQALSSYRKVGNRREEGATLGNLGVAYAELGDSWQAIEYYEQALGIARETTDRYREGATLGNLANVYADSGDTRRAIGYHEQALAVRREIGDRRGEGNALGDMGLVHADLGDPQRAIGYYVQALVIRREIGDRRGEGKDLGNLGVSYFHLGDTRRAIQCLQQALAINREINDRRGEGRDLGNLGLAYADLGETHQAIQYYEQALAIRREISDRRGEGQDLGNLGTAYFQLGDVRCALAYYEHALLIDREINDRRGEGQDLGNLGIVYAALGDVHRAFGYYEQALAIAHKIDDANGVASNSFNMALLHAQQGAPARALPLASEAARIWRQIGHTANTQRAQQFVALLAAVSRPATDPNSAEILRQFGPFIAAVAAVAQGDLRARHVVENAFDMLSQQGWQIANPIRRIWAGDRDEAALTAGLNSYSALVVQAILQQLSS